MDFVAEPLKFIWNLRFSIEKGQSVRVSLHEYLQHNMNSPFAEQLAIWWQLKEKGEKSQSWLTQIENPYRYALFSILERGWDGEPILPALCELEEEFMKVSEDDLARHLQALPVLGLFPLLLLQFPSFLLLLVGPLLKEFIKQIGSL